MSGGHFNYQQYKLIEIADELEQIIIDNDITEKNDYGDNKGYYFRPETIAEFKTGLRLLRQAHVYAQRIDWLVSADDGEDGFHRRLEHELAKLKEQAEQKPVAQPAIAPWVMLTDAEITGLMYDTSTLPECNPDDVQMHQFAAAIQAAFIAKQGGAQ